MTAKTNLVKSSLLALGLGAAIAAPSASQAQSLSIVYSGGGSSALQGGYGPTALTPGAIPTLLTDAAVTVTGFSDSSFAVTGILEANVTIKDPTGAYTDTPAAGTPALIIYSKNGTAYRTCVLVRSDSGFGPRYVANAEQITAFVAQTVGTTTATFWTFSPAGMTRVATADDTTVEGLLTPKLPITLYNGLADVTADTITALAPGFGIGSPTTGAISLSGIQNATQDILPVQTLLFLYNSANEPTGHHLNVSRSFARWLICGLPANDITLAGSHSLAWNQVDPTLTNTAAVDAFFREKSSGTRLTELLDVQRFGVNGLSNIYIEDQFPNNPVTVSPTGNGYGVKGTLDANGTGHMLTALNSDSNAFGYSFVTGGAGNSATNVRVATFDGVAPFSFASGNSVPTSATYSSLTTTTYYVPVTNGTYENWSYANQYQAGGSPQTTVAGSIASILAATDAHTLGVIHSLGFTSTSEMNVTRLFKQSIFSVNQFNGDGQLITFDLSQTAVADTANAIQ